MSASLPSSTVLLATGIIAAVLTVIGTPVVSLLVLWRFRSAVNRSMSSPARRPTTAARGIGPVAGPGPPGVVGPAAGEQLTAVAVRRLRQAVTWYSIAGLSYGVLTSILLLTINGQALLPVRTTLVALVFAWPLVPTLALVCAWSSRGIGLAVAGYATALVLLGLLGSGSVTDPLLLWALYMLPPSLIVAAVAVRRLRAVGPFLAPALFTIGAGFTVWPYIALAVLEAGVPVGLETLLAVVLIGLVAAAMLVVLPIAAWRHRRKAASDQSVLVDQWWLLFTLTHVLLSVPTGVPALLLLAPYLGYLAVLRVGRARSYRQARQQAPRQLLLLRVFGARGRSERLLRQLSAYWRYVGSIELIAGTDLASAALEPHEFLDFLRGALSRQFIADEAELGRRLAELDRWPDRDGRYRVNQFFCHANTWQPTVQALAGLADVILIDVRGLGPRNDGVAYELAMLAHLGALDRTVAMVDASTDRRFLDHVLQVAGGRRPHEVELGGRTVRPVELLGHLEAAAR